jgi:hypothetical protein
MEIKIYCYECGDELEIVEEHTSRGDLIISIGPCSCTDKRNKIIAKLVDEEK